MFFFIFANAKTDVDNTRKLKYLLQSQSVADEIILILHSKQHHNSLFSEYY